MAEASSSKAEMAYRSIVRKDPITGKAVNCALVRSGRKVSLDQMLEEVSANGHGIGEGAALQMVSRTATVVKA